MSDYGPRLTTGLARGSVANARAIGAGERAKADAEEQGGREMVARPSLWACPSCHLVYALTGGVPGSITARGWQAGAICGGCLVSHAREVSLQWVRGLTLEEVS
jgi:hypothetical protein